MSWRKLPLPAADWLPPADNPLPYAGLLSSLPEEHDYECEIDGTLPDINGTLYRVGPGRYDRGPDRKRMMLDGDGMVQQLSIRQGRAQFRNRYVRTPKYVAEEQANRFLYPTFSTHGSGAFSKNLGLNIVNQANTTVLEWAGRLYAFDEGQKPYELDSGLGTIGESILDNEQPKLGYWAHWKLDAVHERLHLLSLVPGPKPSARIVSLDRNGEVAERQTIPLPRSVYIHDWFVTENHFCLLLHPAYISIARMLEIVIARNTFASAIEWRPEKGSVLTVARRGKEDPPRNLPVEPIWMWHAINAFEDGDDLVLDFIAGVTGGGLEDDDPVFGLMGGHDPGPPPAPSNFPRRLRVRPDSDTPEVQLVLDDGNFELPCVSATERGRPYSQAYMIRAIPGELFARTLCELNGETLAARHYEFGPQEFCSEPVICDELDGQPGRYLLTQIYNGADKRSYYAVMDRENFMDGPVARIQLRHHVPVSFHGYWSAAVLD